MKIILALVLGLASAVAQATVVTYSFSGVFGAPTRSVLAGDANHSPLFNGLVKEGDRFSGRFSFDTDAVALSGPDDRNPWVLYPMLDFQLKASDAFNAAVPSWNPSQIQVSDSDAAKGGDELIPSGSARLDSQHVFSTTLRLYPASADAFNGFRVPVGYQDFADATIGLRLFHYDYAMMDHVYAKLDVSFVEAGAVPEPATGMLLLAGLGGFAMLRRRRG